MRTSYAVTIALEVYDPQALYRSAWDSATSGLGGMSPEQATELLGTEQEPDVSACLVMVLDPGISPPGTSIHETTVE